METFAYIYSSETTDSECALNDEVREAIGALGPPHLQRDFIPLDRLLRLLHEIASFLHPLLQNRELCIYACAEFVRQRRDRLRESVVIKGSTGRAGRFEDVVVANVECGGRSSNSRRATANVHSV